MTEVRAMTTMTTMRSKRLRSPLAALAALVTIVALTAEPARAQTVGTIAGHVYDQAGTPIRGVRVTVSSETQIGGAQTLLTDDEGLFRFPGLTPGRFKLVASAPRMRTHEQRNIAVGPGATVDVDVVLELEVAAEEVRIVEKAPVVNTTSATVGDTFDADFLNELPLPSRSYQGVATLTPGVSDISGSGNPNVRGGTYFNNSYQVDGFQTSDPVTQTFGQNFSFDAMSSVGVKTAAFGAENASTTGGIINVITKSGSNRFELDGTMLYSDQNLQFFRDARDIGSSRSAQGSLNVGGPIQKDRIWFFVSAEAIANSFTLPRDPLFPDHPSYRVLGLNSFGKITWQVTSRNKLELKATYSPGRFENQLQSLLVEPEAERRTFQKTRFLGLSWHSALSNNLSLVTRAGVQEIFLDVGPQLCVDNPDACLATPAEQDYSTGILRRNYPSLSKDSRRTVELSGQLEWFKDSRRFGSHNAKLGVRYMGLFNPSAETVPGDVLTGVFGSERADRTEYCSNDPKNDNGVCRQNWMFSDVSARNAMVFLQDNWKPTRYLTISPGVAFHHGRSDDERGALVTDINTVTPHLSAVWDATHDGKTRLSASFNQYIDTGFLALARFTGRQLYERSCDWDPAAGAYVRNCRSSGGDSGRTVGLPCGPDGLNPDGTSCRTRLRAPRTWEYVVGGEREVFTGVAVGTNLIYRQYNHQWEDLETNAVWNEGGTDLRREGRWKTGRSEFVFDLETPDAARRRYKTVEFTLRKREGVLRTFASYSWTRLEGTDASSYASSFLDNPGQTPFYYGPLAGDIRHDVRFQATYQVRRWLSVGTVYQFMSGAPYNRYFFEQPYRSYSRLETRRGYDSNGTLNPDDDTELRLPDVSVINLQVRANLKSIVGKQIDLFADIFNVLALRTTMEVVEQDGPFFGRPERRLPPFQLSLGLRYRF